MKSNALIKFILCTIGIQIGVVVAWGAELVWIVLGLAFSAFMLVMAGRIRCENCDALVYRRLSTKHGMPDWKVFGDWQSCPNCEQERARWF